MQCHVEAFSTARARRPCACPWFPRTESPFWDRSCHRRIMRLRKFLPWGVTYALPISAGRLFGRSRPVRTVFEGGRMTGELAGTSP